MNFLLKDIQSQTRYNAITKRHLYQYRLSMRLKINKLCRGAR